MNVMVTGGTGAMGSWVTRRLVEMGNRPICYDWVADTRLLRDISEKFTVVRGDVTDLGTIIKTMKEHEVERVIHMAYLITESEERPRLALNVNLGGTLNILEAAALTGIKRVVFTSSKGVYGDIIGDHGYPMYKPITEDHPANASRIYSSTKLACEQFGLHYAEKEGLDFVALRFANTFGPGKTIEKHAQFSLVGGMLENALRGEPTNIPMGGDSKDDLLYYKDVAQSVVKATLSEGMKHRIFHFGIGKAFSLHDVAGAVKKVVPSAVIKIGPGLDYKYKGKRPFDGYCVLDTTRARNELGFEPEFDLESAMQDYANELRRLNLVQTT